MRTASGRRYRLVLGLFFASIHLAVSPSAFADGCFVWRNERIDIFEPQQKALIVFGDGWEELVLEVRYEGPAEDFGWIVPLPSVPEITRDTPEVFENLSRLTQSPKLGRWYGPRTKASEFVEVVEERRIGIYDTAVLRGDSGEALEGWLREHGYRLPKGARPVLDEYVSRGWVFTAFRITADSADSTTTQALNRGTIQPLRFRFPTLQPVYPLRISSLLPGESEILIYILASEWMTPKNLRILPWEEMHGGHVKYLDWYLDPEVWASGAEPGFFVTKLRVTLEPEQMVEDLVFRTFSGVIDLDSESMIHRAQGATYLGNRRDRGAVPRLLELVNDSAGPTQDVLSALWALGKIGDMRAEPTLLAWAEHDSALARVEALGSLLALESANVHPILVRALTRFPANSQEKYVVFEERKMAMEHLVRDPRPGLLPELRRVAGAYDAWEAFHDWRLFNLGYDHMFTIQSYVLASLTAVGDSLTRDYVRQVLVQGSSACGTSSLMKPYGGSVNDFPTGFGLGQAIFLGRSPLPQWPGLGFVREVLATNPLVQDDLLRAALASGELAPGAVVLLTALLHEPTTFELETLRLIWREAFGPDKLMKTVALSQRNDECSRSVDYNLLACAVAHAYGRQGYVSGLLDLLAECPEDDPVLRGEIALAATRIPEPAAIDLVLAYVRDVWNRACQTGDFPVAASDLTDVRELSSEVREWDQRLDLRYRVTHMTRFLREQARDRVLEEIILDREQHRYHRMYWMRMVARSPAKPSDEGLGRLVDELVLIADAHPENLRTQSAVRITREQLERRAEFVRTWRAEHPPRLW